MISRSAIRPITGSSPAFYSAFFSLRGSRCLFFFANFGTFTDFVCGFSTGGASTGALSTAATILPAALPTFFAALTSTPSDVFLRFCLLCHGWGYSNLRRLEKYRQLSVRGARPESIDAA